MGCHHPHPGCSGGCTSILGSHWVAGMGGTGIVPPIAYPVRHSGRACMKGESPVFPLPAKKGRDRPFGRFLLHRSDFYPVMRADFSIDPEFHPAISLPLTGREERTAS